MVDTRILDEIGRRLRAASAEVLEDELPEEWRAKLSRLRELERQDEGSTRRSRS